MASGKILVVDDDRNICELLRLYIEKEGFTVVIANDGRQALEVFESDQPDLIMLAIMLPELDGWQVCREIRKKSQCPIIMLTAKGEVFDKVLGLELGADDYVCLLYTSTANRRSVSRFVRISCVPLCVMKFPPICICLMVAPPRRVVNFLLVGRFAPWYADSRISAAPRPGKTTRREKYGP